MNAKLIARLVRYVDVFNPEDKSITAYTVVQALTHRAIWGSRAASHATREQRSLEVAIEDLIRTDYPTSYCNAGTLNLLLVDMADLAVNAND